jgi:hypothetical protein
MFDNFVVPNLLPAAPEIFLAFDGAGHPDDRSDWSRIAGAPLPSR